MKKIYLGAFASIFCVGMSVAQVVESPYVFDNIQMEAVEQAPSDLTFTPKALGITFWTEDFTGGLGSWVIDNDGQTGADFGWSVDATSDGWWSAGGITSTSGGDFAELSNGDAQAGTQALDVVYSLTSPAIDIQTLAGTDQITLTFEEFGARFNDLQEVQVSTDGNSFTTVRNNLGYTTLSSTGGSAYANPEMVSVNLAPYITGATTIYLRYTWTTNFPAFSTNPSVWITYGWYIDDIALTTNPDNDITAEESVWGSTGLNYHQIPLSQQTAIEFTTIARNNGIATQTDVQLNVDVTGAATFSGTSPLGTSIAAGAADSLVISTPFTPSGLGTYDVTWGLTQNEVDDIPTDNGNDDITFDVTNFTYARDKGTEQGAFNNAGELFVLGSYYDAFANDVIYSVDVKIASNAVIGSVISGRIYSLDPNGTTLAAALVLEDQSIEYTLATGDPGQIINLDLAANGSAGFPIIAGETYFVAVASDGDGGTTNGAAIGTTEDGIPQTCFLYDGPDDTWYFTLNTPMVRMNLDPASNNIGLDEQSQLFGAEVFPNPATDNVSVRYIMGAASEVTIKVTDITGKVVAEFEEGTQTEGTHTLDVDASSFAEGVYYVTIASGNSILTKKLVKK